MAELGYPSGIHEYIFYTALFLHPTHIYCGFSLGMNLCAIMGLTLYATSLNYWRNPVMSSYRRTVDTIVAKTSIAYHIYLSFYTTNRFLTTLPLTTGSGLYLVSFYLYKKMLKVQHFATACFMHWSALVHLSHTKIIIYRRAILNLTI